ncbi:hypothetical protein J6590_078384 [Homalodisca vitripennis]|nr:hypothetical protein J6590_078384 [Homalodisca vitripennis]
MHYAGCGTVLVYSLVELTLLDVCRCTPFVVCERLSVQVYRSKEEYVHCHNNNTLSQARWTTPCHPGETYVFCSVFTGLVSSGHPPSPHHSTPLLTPPAAMTTPSTPAHYNTPIAISTNTSSSSIHPLSDQSSLLQENILLKEEIKRLQTN